MKNKLSIKVPSIIGPLILISVSFLLYFYVIVNAYIISITIGFFVTLLLTGLTFQYIHEIKLSLNTRFIELNSENIFILLSVFVASSMTFFLSNNAGLGPVIASGLVGMLFALALSKYSVPAFCGSFVGMLAVELTSGYLNLLLATTIAGIVFILNKNSFNGLGGKLGTIAFCGSISMIYFTGQSPTSSEIYTGTTILIVILWATLGTILTYMFSVRLKLGPVIASSLFGLIGGILLPFLHPSLPGISAVFYAATFTGMSSQERFKNYFSIIFVGVITGIIFILSMPNLGGAGGKLGTIAFLSATSLSGVINLVKLIPHKNLMPSSKSPSYRS